MKCSALGLLQKGRSKTRLVVVVVVVAVVAAAAAATAAIVVVVVVVVVVFEILAETRCAIQIHSTSFFFPRQTIVLKKKRGVSTQN